MSRPVPGPRRAGYALILLTTVAGSASGAPPTESTASTPAPSTQQQPHAVPATPVVVAYIPCISGTCQVLVPASADTAPASPGNVTAPR